MLVTNGAQFQPEGETALALGTFDGLHRAHGEVLALLREKAAGMRTAVYTFANVPAAYFGGRDMALFTRAEKIRAFESAGVDALILDDFSGKIASVRPEKFYRFLTEKLGARKIITGYNYTFGAQAEGTVDMLRELAAEDGVEVFVQKPVTFHGEPVSSTRIREALLLGDAEKAEALLGRPYAIDGAVMSGKRLGRTMGFPTVNIFPPKGKLCPQSGVYAAITEYAGVGYPSIANIGTRPTVDDGDFTNIESHMIGFSGDIYGKPIRVLLKKRMRGEVRFANVAALQNQLARDREQALRLLRA